MASWSELAWAVLVTVLLCTPLAISAWALLDVARRPSWAWSLADRSQVAWLGAVMFGVLFNVLGLAISGWYLVKVRPVIAAAERGQVPG